jgi:hypothetical protein
MQIKKRRNIDSVYIVGANCSLTTGFDRGIASFEENAIHVDGITKTSLTMCKRRIMCSKFAE